VIKKFQKNVDCRELFTTSITVWHISRTTTLFWRCIVAATYEAWRISNVSLGCYGISMLEEIQAQLVILFQTLDLYIPVKCLLLLLRFLRRHI